MTNCRRWFFALALLMAQLMALAAPAQAYFDPVAEAGIDRIADAGLPAGASLIDQAGRPVRLGDYFGGPPLVFAAVAFQCPNLCGLTLDGLFAGLNGAGLTAGRDYRVVVMSIDPREGPAQASQMLGELSARWRIDRSAVHFLTGSAEVVGQVTRAMGIRSGWDAEHQQYAHIAAAAVTRPDGRLSQWFAGIQFDPRALRLGLVEAGKGKVGTLGDQVLLLCYGFDPVRGRYGWVVRPMLGVGAAAMLGGLALYLWWPRRRQPRGGR